eukprot:6174937-Pleurochrysis_carterae.AAC.1
MADAALGGILAALFAGMLAALFDGTLAAAPARLRWIVCRSGSHDSCAAEQMRPWHRHRSAARCIRRNCSAYEAARAAVAAKAAAVAVAAAAAAAASAAVAVEAAPLPPAPH